jgi:hypothetical protein
MGEGGGQPGRLALSALRPPPSPIH